MAISRAQLLKELVHQQKHLKREDVRNSKKSNQKLLKLAMLLDEENKKIRRKW